MIFYLIQWYIAAWFIFLSISLFCILLQLFFSPLLQCSEITILINHKTTFKLILNTDNLCTFTAPSACIERYLSTLPAVGNMNEKFIILLLHGQPTKRCRFGCSRAERTRTKDSQIGKSYGCLAHCPSVWPFCKRLCKFVLVDNVLSVEYDWQYANMSVSDDSFI